ncbi:MAG: cytochrome-c peroxidase, partial [Pseudomonadota bacterium]
MPAPAEIWKTIFARPGTIPAPKGNPITPAKIALGRELFFDKQVSGDGQRSCASCHDPALGFSDGRSTALGRNGQPLRRNTMSLWNLAWSK